MSKWNRRRGLAALAGLLLAVVVAVVAVALADGRGSASPDESGGGHGGCPLYDHQLLTSHVAGADGMLVPAGARRVTLCRYSGVALDPATARRLQAHRRLDGLARVNRLAAEFNALGPMVGVAACPADNGTQVIAIFGGYPGPASQNPVTVDLTGCLTTTNGPVTRLGSAPLVAQLTALTPAHH
jgi:hypothetical protein